MKVVVPLPVTNANYIPYPTDSVYGYNENYDYPAYSNVTAYVAGNRVTYQQNLYLALIGSTGVNPVPEGNSSWIKTGASNAWKPFDGIVSSPSVGYTFNTQRTDYMFYSLVGMGRFSTVCVLSTDAAFVQVFFTAPDGSTTSKTMYAADTTPIIDAWSYCFADLNVRRDFIFDGIDGWGTTPSAQCLIVVSNQNTGVPVLVGEIVVGNAYDIGECHAGAKLSLNDFSRKEQNEFGDFVIVKRPFNYAGSFEIEIDADRRNRVQGLVSLLRATPCVWFPSQSDADDGLAIYGFEKSFEINYDTPERAYATLEVEGLT